MVCYLFEGASRKRFVRTWGCQDSGGERRMNYSEKIMTSGSQRKTRRKNGRDNEDCCNKIENPQTDMDGATFYLWLSGYKGCWGKKKSERTSQETGSSGRARKNLQRMNEDYNDHSMPL